MQFLKNSWRLVSIAFSLGLISGSLFFIAPVQATKVHDNISMTIENSEWIALDHTYNAISFEFLEGQTEAEVRIAGQNSAYDFHKNEEFEDERFSELITTEPFSKFQVFSAGKVEIFLYNTISRKNEAVFASSQNIGSAKIISRASWGADESLRYDYRSEADRKKSQERQSSAPASCQKLIDTYPQEYTYDRVVQKENNQPLLWPRQYSKKVQKIVLHHTAESEKSKNREGGEKMRAIYQYHTKTRGWGDIGYNFVIDQNGNIYEGRAGGDKVVGAHAYCSNINTIGVALMGNFMNSSPTPQQVASLAQLLQGLSVKYNVPLSQKSTFHGDYSENLLGHRDTKATSCPGDNLYKVMPILRKHLTYNKALSITGTQDEAPLSEYGMTLSGNPTIISIGIGSEKKVILQFKNTGKITWDQRTWLYAEHNMAQTVHLDPIVIDKPYVVGILQELNVKPGEIGTFELTIKSDLTQGLKIISVVPVINAKRRMQQAEVSLAIQVEAPSLNYDIINYTAPPKTFYFGQRHSGKLLVKNTGNLSWQRSGDYQITLDTINISGFANPETPYTLARLEEKEVHPGEHGTFIFEMFGGFQEGNYEVTFRPRLGGKLFFEKIPETTHSFTIKRANYQTQIQYNSKDISFFPSEKRNIPIKIKNLSSIDWQENEISLKLVQSNGILIDHYEFDIAEAVKMEDTGEINITITAPTEPGKYILKFHVLSFDKAFKHNRWIELPIFVNNSELSAKINYIKQSDFQLKETETDNILIRFKNTGSIPWEKTGPNALKIMHKKFKSDLQHTSWLNTYTPTSMEEKRVVPGKTATFRFIIQNNANQHITETYHLKTKSLGIIPGSEFTISVKNPSIHQPKQTTNNSRLEAIFQKANDKRAHMQTSQLEQVLQNGANKRKIKESEKLAAVFERAQQRRAAAQSKNKMPQNTTVQNNNNNIRVKLSFDQDAANIITTQTKADITLDGVNLSLMPGDSLWTRKEKNQLIISINGKKYFGNILRVSAPSYVTLNNWNRSPSWNPNIFDNTFQGALEFRLDDGKLIAINDLDFEDYLRGIAEVPEFDENEKRKTIAVISRSYAWHYTKSEYRKFPNKPYDGSDSPAVFQKYLGYNYTLRSPKWQKVVTETKNEKVYFQDKVLKTAYFSCSNGITRTPEQARWTSDYFNNATSVYIAVDDTYGKDMTRYNAGRCGHGVGLSGLGATNMAKNGKTYHEILHYYYQNIVIR